MGIAARIATAVAVFAGSAVAAMADWRSEIGTFRIGVLASGGNSASLSSLEPFRLAVLEALGVDVEIFPARDLASLVAAQNDGRIEYSVMPASGYGAVWQLCECIEPLVAARSVDGTSGFSTIVVARQGGPVNSLDDLPGRKVLVLSAGSIAGENVVAAQIGVEGGDPAAINFVSEGTPREILERFAAGEGDALVGWSSMTGDPSAGYTRGTLRQLAELPDGRAQDYRLAWRSASIPNRVHLVRRNLAPEAKEILRELLKNLAGNDAVAYEAIEPVFGGGFVPVTHAELQAAILAVRHVAGAPSLPSAGGEEEPDAVPAEN